MTEITVAIVGHGAGLSAAREIDAADIVIRMHDWHWQSPQMHGRRCSYCIFPAAWSPQRWRPTLKSYPDIAYLAYQTSQRPIPFEIDSIPVLSERADVRWTAERLRELAPRHEGRLVISRGTAAVLLAMSYFPNSQISIFGFNAMRPGAQRVRYDDAYLRQWSAWGAQEPRLQRGGYKCHNFAAERVLIEEQAAMRAARLAWIFGDENDGCEAVDAIEQVG